MKYFPFLLLIPGFHQGLGSLALYLMASGYLCIIFSRNSGGVFSRRESRRQLNYLYLSAGLLMTALSINFLYSGTEFISSRFSYLLRLIASYSTFFFAYHIFRTDRFGDIKDHQFRKNLIVVFLVGAAIEFTAMVSGYPLIIDLFKAREDIGGIDTFHYDRFSGLFSYPGDFGFAAIVLMPLALMTKFTNTVRAFIILVLFITLALSESRLSIALLIASIALYALLNPRYFMHWKPALLLLIGAITIVVYYTTLLDEFRTNMSYVDKMFTKHEYYLWESKRATEWITLADASIVELMFGLDDYNIQDFYESEWAGAIARTGILGSVWLFILAGVATACLIRAKHMNDNALLFLCCILFCYIGIYCLFSAGISRWKIGLLSQTLLAWSYMATKPARSSSRRKWLR